MAVLSRQAGRVTTSRAGPAGGESAGTAMTWRLLPSSSDLLCRGAGPDCRDCLLQSRRKDHKCQLEGLSLTITGKNLDLLYNQPWGPTDYKVNCEILKMREGKILTRQKQLIIEETELNIKIGYHKFQYVTYRKVRGGVSWRYYVTYLKVFCYVERGKIPEDERYCTWCWGVIYLKVIGDIPEGDRWYTWRWEVI